jgi:hypothetical protein
MCKCLSDLLLVMGVFFICGSSAVLDAAAIPVAGLCYGTNVNGVKGCSMDPNDPCPPQQPNCGKATGGDGCSCK